MMPLYERHRRDLSAALLDSTNGRRLVEIGLGDDVVPPETGYDLLKVMPGEVEFHAWERCGHDAGIYWEMPKVEAFLDRHLKPALANTGLHAQKTEG